MVIFLMVRFVSFKLKIRVRIYYVLSDGKICNIDVKFMDIEYLVFIVRFGYLGFEVFLGLILVGFFKVLFIIKFNGS